MAHVPTATVLWQRGDQPFTDRKYSRAHVWQFDGGINVPGSSSPSVVRLPLSREDAVDPEEALIASLSSCHMLTFLDLAARAGLRIDSYRDAAVAAMAKNDKGKWLVSRITLNPEIVVSGDVPATEALVSELHHKAHEECFIANSLLTEVVVTPLPSRAA